MTIGVYFMKCPGHLDGYIGSSVNCERREQGHNQKLLKGDHHCKFFQRKYNKYGKHEMFILFETSLERHEKEPWLIREMEQDFIDDWQNGVLYNSTLSTFCASHDPKVGRRISRTLIKGYASGRIHKTSYGHTDVIVEKISDSKVGYKHTVKTRKKWSKMRKGVAKSESHKRAISYALMGRNGVKVPQFDAHKVNRIRREFSENTAPENKYKSMDFYKLKAAELSVSWATIYNIINRKHAYA